MKEAMETKLSQLSKDGVTVDSITFSGNGEPTMNPDFSAIVDATIQLRDRYFPSAKISVLSNATMLERKEVFEALKKVDNPILKIDAASDELIVKINRPQGVYSLSRVIERLACFEGNFILQTMFLHSDDFDAQTEVALEGWRNIVRHLKPREVMVYTIDRETPDKTLKKCSVKELETFVAPLMEEGFNIQIRG